MRTLKIFKPANPNYEYYNLFVIDQEQLDSLVAIPRKQSLNEYTAAEIRKVYALPGLAAAEEIKRLPSLFVIRNKFGNHTTMDMQDVYLPIHFKEWLIDEAPSIDIVFCKECKYYEAKEDWCYWRDEAITADDFCSYGERKEGE